MMNERHGRTSPETRFHEAAAHLLLVIGQLSPGGAERVMLTLVENMDWRDRRPVLVVLGSRDRLSSEVPTWLETHYLNKGGRLGLPRVVRRLRKLVQELSPAVIFGIGIYRQPCVLARGQDSEMERPDGPPGGEYAAGVPGRTAMVVEPTLAAEAPLSRRNENHRGL